MTPTGEQSRKKASNNKELKEATEEKRPMLSDQIELTGDYLVLTSD